MRLVLSCSKGEFFLTTPECFQHLLCICFAKQPMVKKNKQAGIIIHTSWNGDQKETIWCQGLYTPVSNVVDNELMIDG